MQSPSFDPGLTQKYDGPLRRVINADGSFNVLRRGTTWRDINPYLHLVSIGWTHFFGWVLLFYVFVNSIFAAIYFLLGPEALTEKVAAGHATERYLHWVDAFFRLGAVVLRFREFHLRGDLLSAGS